MSVYNNRMKKRVRLAQPQQFLAQDRAMVEDAYPGDIIGVFDTGTFRLGDTLCNEKEPFSFDPIPMFPAEHFAYVSAEDIGKRKQFMKGIEQLMMEGAIQVFQNPDYGTEKYIVGVAGALQLEVLSYRMLGEYGVQIRLESLAVQYARWVFPETATPDFPQYSSEIMRVTDSLGRQVILFNSRWALQRAEEKNKSIQFLDIAP